MSALEDFIRGYRGPGFRVGKYLRMRGVGYNTIFIGTRNEDEKRAIEIIDALSIEDCAVLGRIFDAAWYEQNERDIAMLEAIKKDSEK